MTSQPIAETLATILLAASLLWFLVRMVFEKLHANAVHHINHEGGLLVLRPEQRTPLADTCYNTARRLYEEWGLSLRQLGHPQGQVTGFWLKTSRGDDEHGESVLCELLLDDVLLYKSRVRRDLNEEGLTARFKSLIVVGWLLSRRMRQS